MRDTRWFKSSRSGGGSDACVEVRITGVVASVRDSKNPDGGQLTVGWTEFAALLASVK